MPVNLKLLAAALALVAQGACRNNDAAAVTENAVVEPASRPPVSFGKPGEAPGVTITVNSVKRQRLIGPEGVGAEAADGETFVVVRYTLKNTGTKPLDTLARPTISLIDADGQSYAEDTQATALAGALNDGMPSGTLNPKVSAKETAVWKLDKAAFDKAKWHLRATFDDSVSATIDKAIAWPRETKAGTVPPVLFSLQ